MSQVLRRWFRRLVFFLRGSDISTLPVAACVLVINNVGQVLAVSRKHDRTKFGLPGGKVDPADSPRAAAERELKEETGLDIVKMTSKPVFSRNDGEYLTHTFFAEVKGQIHTTEKGAVEWVDPDVLLRGPFKKYNRALFRHVGWDY